jgi:hypothetical protein
MATVETVFAAIGAVATLGGLAFGAYKIAVRGDAVKNGDAFRKKK